MQIFRCRQDKIMVFNPCTQMAIRFSIWSRKLHELQHETTRDNTRQHEYNTSTTRDNTSTTRVQHDATRHNTSTTRDNTRQHEYKTT